METTHSKDFKAWNWEHAVFHKVKMIILGGPKDFFKNKNYCCGSRACSTLLVPLCLSEPGDRLFWVSQLFALFPLKEGWWEIKE